MNSPNEPDFSQLSLDELLEQVVETQDEQAEAISDLLGRDGPKRTYTTKSSQEWKYIYLAKLLVEYTRRVGEGWKLYTPLPKVAKFHDRETKFRILVGSNRAGKTFAAVIDVVKYALTNAKKRILIVGKDTDHLGQVLWRKMSWAGESGMQIIRDEVTGKYRALKLTEDCKAIHPDDLARKAEWRPGPPLLPERYIADTAWDNKALNVPRLVTLTNGTELWFRTSNGKPPAGVDLDGVWFDEELESSDRWYSECVARLIDRKGWFMWSATPQVGNEELDALYDDAENGAEWVSVFEITLEDNPYLDPEEKEIFKATLHDEDEIAVRYFGKRIRQSRRVYPYFAESGIHVVAPTPIPADWTRYLALDPGWQVCAAVCLAVPPDGKEMHIFREFWLRGANAKDVGKEIAYYLRNEPMYEAFIIDNQMGRQTNMASGKAFAEHYSEAFAQAGLESRSGGSNFFPGLSNVADRTEMLRQWMIPDSNGNVKLRIHGIMCPYLIKNIKSAVFHKDVPDKRVQRDLHALDCLEYLAGFGPYYHAPVNKSETVADAYSVQVAKQLKQKRETVNKQEREDRFWRSRITPQNVESILSRVIRG